MTEQEKLIIQSIKKMGFDRTAYRRDLISAVISKAITAFEQTQWIPIKTRPWTAEDKEEMQSRLGEDLFDDDGVVYDCELPDDAEEVEVTTRYGNVVITTFYNDYNYGSYFENYEDYDDILAWRRVEPYRKESEDKG